MPLLFIDYTNLILKAYEEGRAANRLSRLLMHPTTANIRQECLNVYKERSKKGDIEEDILRAFFGVPPIGRNFDHIIDRYHADRFRPLRSLINRKVKNPSLINVELLAWLIDFNPRPLAYAQTMLAGMNEQPGSIPNSTVKGSVEPTEPLELNPPIINTTDATSQSPKTAHVSLNDHTNNKRKKWYTRGVIASLTLIICTGGMYALWPQKKDSSMIVEKAQTVCGYWASDHYEAVSCNEDPKGRIILPMSMERMNVFRRIMRTDTITEWSIGKIYYIRDSGIIKYYTGAGNYPEDITRPLKVLSTYMFKKHLDKKGIPGNDTLAEQNKDENK